MKKLSKRHRYWAINEQLRTRKIQRRNRRKYKVFSHKWWDRSLKAPKVFSLSTPDLRAELLCFISQICVNDKPYEQLRLDFRGTEKIVADAMLLFVARLEQQVLINKRFVKVRIKLPYHGEWVKQDRIRQVLSKVGALEICGQNIKILPKDERVIYWKKLSGFTDSPLDARKIITFLEDGHDGIPTVLTVAFKEALLNIKHHAYYQGEVGGWWLVVFCSRQR